MDTNINNHDNQENYQATAKLNKFSHKKIIFIASFSLAIFLLVLIALNSNKSKNEQDKLAKLNNILVKKDEVASNNKDKNVNYKLHNIAKNNLDANPRSNSSLDKEQLAQIKYEKQQLRMLLNRKEIENNKLTNSLKSLKIAKLKAEKLLQKEIDAKNKVEAEINRLAEREKIKKITKELAQNYADIENNVVYNNKIKSKVLSINDKQLLDAPNNNYCIQLLGASSEKSIKQFIAKHKLGAKANYYKSNAEDKDWYVLVYGSFNNVKEADNVIAKLPEEIQNLKPFIRKYGSVKKSMRR